MSTIMPRRFISQHDLLAEGGEAVVVVDLGSSMSPEESAHSLVLDQVRVM